MKINRPNSLTNPSRRKISRLLLLRKFLTTLLWLLKFLATLLQLPKIIATAAASSKSSRDIICCFEKLLQSSFEASRHLAHRNLHLMPFEATEHHYRPVEPSDFTGSYSDLIVSVFCSLFFILKFF